MKRSGFPGLALFLFALNTHADNKVTISEDDHYRYIVSNGIPDHDTGRFPNRGNPNAISEQQHRFRVTLNPRHTGRATPVQLAGIAINGIPMEPGTAEFWNRDRTSGWNIQAFASGINLGIDQHNAHVQPGGMYHYHGMPQGLVEGVNGTLLGWAADGFEIHYVGSRVKPSYRVKSGMRPSGPRGKYDGTYEQDWEYVEGLGDLDECNGGQLNGDYVYFMTDAYPFIQRCVFGIADASFRKQGPPPGRPRRDGRADGDFREFPPPPLGPGGRRPPPR